MANFSRSEERINTWSHAAGILIALVAGGVFLWLSLRSSDVWAALGVGLYLFGMAASYVTSTLYHALPPGHTKWVLRRWDHAAIYWHIAGSYSPVTLVALRHAGGWGWGLFGFVWVCAAVGTLMSFRHLREHSHLETVCFVLMGLSVLVAFPPLLAAVPPSAVWWIVAEGVCYITGAVFYTLRREYMHAVFHFFVLAGSLCHILAVRDVLFACLP
ncbi:MAG: hemolysin III family protein [Alloprevotella sp.]|nr:hemolysin III family protein [Alloprevotella sp.]